MLSNWKLFTLALLMCQPVLANDWSSRWAPSDTRNALQTGQAGAIKLAESGYYDRVGESTYNVTNNSNSTSTTSIGQNTNSIGSVNTSTNNVSVTGSNNALGLENSSSNTGGVDGSVGFNANGQGGQLTTCMGVGSSTASTNNSACR